jgi:hypothetical protein
MYSSVPINYSHRKLTKNLFTSSPCLCTFHEFLSSCSQKANNITYRVEKCGLCRILYEREKSSVVLQVFENKVQG